MSDPAQAPHESGDEFEEVLVFVKFSDFEGLSLLKDTDTVELIGLETENPICKIRDMTFAGEHCTSLGTQAFFEKQDHADGSSRTKLAAMTTDAIEFSFQKLNESK